MAPTPPLRYARVMTTTLIRPVLCQDPKFRGYLGSNAWTLVVGAGISKGIVPDWQELAVDVVREAYDASLSKEDVQLLFKDSGWSMDSWIQAAANVYLSSGKPLDEFKHLLEKMIYSVVRDKAKGMGLESYLTAVLNEPTEAPRGRVIEVCDFLESAFPNCSLFQVARALQHCCNTGHSARAVLTFNADTLLETYIVLAARRKHYLGPGPYGHPPYEFVQVTRSGSTSAGKIPIIHCHGALSPKPMTGRPHRDSRDRLVFLEREYLAMASREGAWGETMFNQLAHTSKMVFVGLSMSDPNIRRWMNAVQEEKVSDLLSYGVVNQANPSHIWIRSRPKPPLDSLFVPALVHLGIRPGWIDSWSHLEDGIGNLTASS